MSALKKSTLLRSGSHLALLTLASRILGLVREMTKAAFLGTSALSDAFGIAFMIPNLFRRLFAENSISVAFIPTFKAHLEDAKKSGSLQDAAEFVNAVCTVVSFISAVTVALGIIVAPLVVPLFYGEAGGDITEAVFLTRLLFPYLLIISIAAFFQGILNAQKSFAPSGFTPILFNIFVITATYVLSPVCANSARAMSLGVLAGSLVQAAFQLPFVLKHGWRPRLMPLNRAFKNAGLRTVLRRIGPTIIGMAAYQINDVVGTVFATRAGAGIVSSLQYSLRVQELFLGIFAVTVGTVILPDLSSFAKNAQWQEFSSLLEKAIRVIALITIPVTFFSLVMGENIIIFLYKSKRFTDESVALTTRVFYFHIAGLFFIALNRVLSPAFYAQGDTKSPTLAGVIGFAVNIALSACLVRRFAGSGIAFALSAASVVNTACLLVFLYRRNILKSLPVLSVIVGVGKIALFSVIAAAALTFLKPILAAPFASYNRFIAQGVPLTVGALAFFGIIAALLFVTKGKKSIL